MKALDKLVSQPAERIARLDASTSTSTVRTDTLPNQFDNRPTWDNWSNNR